MKLSYLLRYVLLLFLLQSVPAETKLAGPNDTGQFGKSVDMNGEWAAVGAPLDDNSNGADAGSVFLYHFNGSGWDSTQMIKAYGGNPGDQFGYSVALSGNYLVVGAPYRQNGSGMIYIFHYNGETWSQQAALVPEGTGAEDNVGYSVDIDGSYIVVGAPHYDFLSGTVYVYAQENGLWTEQARLTPANISYGWNFGYAVALHDDLIAAGAPGRDDGFENTTGLVSVFRRSGSTWTEEAQLFVKQLSDEQTSQDPQFGISVDVYGNYLIAGATGDDQNGPYSDTGSACIYFFSGGSWQFQAKLKLSNYINGDEFGRAVALYDTYALVGAPRRDETGRNSGAVYAYLREDTTWTLKHTQTASDIDSIGFFGCAVAIDSAWAVMGSGFDARGDSSVHQNAYIYHNQGELNLVSSVSAVTPGNTTATSFRLEQNYPNPFNPVTAIRYSLATAGKVELNIYNILGQRVTQLFAGNQPAGKHSLYWNAQNFPGGVYFCTLTTDKGFSQTRKMILLK